MNHVLLHVFCIVMIAFTSRTAKADGPVSKAPQRVSIINGGDLVAVLSASRRSVTVYNQRTSTETTVELLAPLPEDRDIAVSADFVAFQTDDSVYALNAKTAVWSQLQLPPDSELSFQVSDNAVFLLNDNVFYCYGRRADAWSGIRIEDGATIPGK